MQYIDLVSTDNNIYHYSPSGNLKRLFQDLVVKPLSESRPDVVANPSIIPSLSQSVLERGKTNFDGFTKNYPDYTLEDKVLLYCVDYMPMHLYSSYHFYTTALTPLITSNNVIFVDFGCGPLTSGIAFWAASVASKPFITYIGIDTSETMRTKAGKINQYGFRPDRPEYMSGTQFYPDVRFYRIRDYIHQLTHLLETTIIQSYGDTLIIFNFCYFLQSETLDISSLARVVSDIVSQHDRYKFSIVYQDPIGDGFQNKWRNFKKQMAKNLWIFSSFTWKDNLNITPLKYDRLLLPGQHSPRVYYAMAHNW